MITLSIIVPVYNNDQTLPSCLDSLLTQEGSFLEFLIIDDSSKNNKNCKSIIKPYLKKDKRFKYISHRQNRGTLQARITGIEKAKGEYLLFVDSDDILLSSTACKEIIEKVSHEKVDLFRFQIQPTHTTNQALINLLSKTLPKNYTNPSTKFPITELFFLGESIPLYTCGQVTRTAIAQRAIDYIPSCYCVYQEDLLLNFFFSFFAKSFSSTSECYYQWNIGSGISTTKAQLSPTQWEMRCTSALVYKIIFPFINQLEDKDFALALSEAIQTNAFTVVRALLKALQSQISLDYRKEAYEHLVSQFGDVIVAKVEEAIQ